MKRARGTARGLAILVILLIAAAYAGLGRYPQSIPDAVSTGPDIGDIARLYESKRSGDVVEGSGIVDRLLADDRDGSRHQRFILELDSGRTLLVAHNIDLAPRVADLKEGDHVSFRGQYEWNPQGGVLHWTHHDPDGQRPGGWIQVDGETYR